jgi:peptidoglycan/LPS O-acetylase OafA/YrhL
MGLIRILLALSVLVGHMGGIFGFHLAPPPIAVELFFIISGFYMALILTEKYNSYGLFISNRFLKIYPAYLFIVLVTIGLSFIYFLKTHSYENGLVGKVLSAREKLSPGTMTLLLLPNLTIFGQDIMFFLKTDAHYHLLFATNFTDSPLVLIRFLAVPQAWSISLELMFYLIAPFLVKMSTKVLGIFIALGIALKIILYTNGLNFDPWTYRFFPAELLFFLLGIISYRFYKSPTFASLDARLTGSASNLCYGTILAILFFYSYLIGNQLLFALSILLFTFSLPFIFSKFKKNKLDKKIGDFSYELYICHELVVYALMATLAKVSHHDNLNKLMAVIASLSFAYIVSWLITQKIDKFRQARLRRTNAGRLQPAAAS